MKIGVFGYNFEHFKTFELVKNTYSNGFDVAAVFLAPRVLLGSPSENERNTILKDEKTPSVLDFCEKNDIPFYIVAHEDVDLIAEAVSRHEVDIGLIGGARILKQQVIRLFSRGVVNYHPGRIPETSGLDSLYRTIEARIPPCITAHFIDERVDAGLFILEQRVKFDHKDSLDDIKRRILIEQINLNYIVLTGLSKNAFSCPEIIRPRKNCAADEHEKMRIMQGFDSWKSTFAEK